MEPQNAEERDCTGSSLACIEGGNARLPEGEKARNEEGGKEGEEERSCTGSSLACLEGGNARLPAVERVGRQEERDRGGGRGAEPTRRRSG